MASASRRFGMLFFLPSSPAGVIARATRKEAIRQPVFLLLLGIAILILVINTFLPFFSFGDDVKMLKDCGLATILVCGLLLAVWTSSTSIADEIEGKTAMTLLSKPINRRQFIVGKYMGILQTVLLLLIPLAICLILLIYYKVGYDARESSKEIPSLWEWITVRGIQVPVPNAERGAAVAQILPPIVLIFLEAAVLTSVSVALATRLPMIVNMVACFAIFVIGHLTPVLVETTLVDLEFVKFMAQLIATLLPSLEIFNTSAVILKISWIV